MIKAKVGLNGVEETVTKAILIKATEDIIKYLGFNHDIYYTMEDTETIDREKDKLGVIRSYSSPRNERIVITHEEAMVDSSDLSLSYIRPDHRVLYEDKDIKSTFTPVYLKRLMTLEFKYTAKSRSLVNKLINNLRLLTASDGMYITHDFKYHYILPIFCFKLLDELNTKKNDKLVNPLDIETYINNHFNTVTTINAPDGDSLKSSIAIREQQTNVLGYISSNLGDIKKEKEDDESAWSMTFSYSFEFESPVQLSLRYPIMVYNQLIDPSLREFMETPYTTYKGKFNPGTQELMEIANSGMADYMNTIANKGYLTIPVEDTVKLPRPDPYTARLLSVMTYVDPTQPNLLFNISEIPDFSFKDSVLDLWRVSEYQHISKVYDSLFTIVLYKDGERDPDNYVIMDSDLNLTTFVPMTENALYRVVFVALTDLNLLSPKSRNRINKYMISIASDGITPSIVKHFAGIYSIPADALPKHDNPIEALLAITDNNWTKFYNVQETVIVTSVLKSTISNYTVND